MSVVIISVLIVIADEITEIAAQPIDDKLKLGQDKIRELMKNNKLDTNLQITSLSNGESVVDIPVFLNFVNATSKELVIGLDVNAPLSDEEYRNYLQDYVGNDVPLKILYGYYVEESCDLSTNICDPVLGGISMSVNPAEEVPLGGTIMIPVTTNTGINGFVTAAHNAGWETIGDIVHQPDFVQGGNTLKKEVGTVTINPPFDSSNNRKSDSAFVKINPDIELELKIFNPNGEAFEIVAYLNIGDVQNFDTVYKHGAVTGLTVGNILGTGLEIQIDQNRDGTIDNSDNWALTNQFIASYDSSQGDSGAPVFTLNSNDDATIVGLHQGSVCFFELPAEIPTYDLDNCVSSGSGYIGKVISPWENIRNDLGLQETTSLIPNAPILSITSSTDQINLSWSAVDNGNTITDYIIQKKTDNGSFVTINDGTNTNTSYVDTNLSPGTYTYKVAAVSSAGTGIFSNEVTTTISTSSQLPPNTTQTTGATLPSTTESQPISGTSIPFNPPTTNVNSIVLSIPVTAINSVLHFDSITDFSSLSFDALSATSYFTPLQSDTTTAITFPANVNISNVSINVDSGSSGSMELGYTAIPPDNITFSTKRTAIDKLVLTLSKPINNLSLTPSNFNLNTGTVTAVETFAFPSQIVNLSISGMPNPATLPVVTFIATIGSLSGEDGGELVDGESSGSTADDSDNDGIPDFADSCIAEPETFNGFEDADGCPDDIATQNQKPDADAGFNVLVVTEGDTVHFDGSASSDPDGNSLNYLWMQTNSTGVTIPITNAGNVQASFVAPDVSSSTTFKFKLTVTEQTPDELSDADSFTVTVNPIIEGRLYDRFISSPLSSNFVFFGETMDASGNNIVIGMNNGFHITNAFFNTLFSNDADGIAGPSYITTTNDMLIVNDISLLNDQNTISFVDENDNTIGIIQNILTVNYSQITNEGTDTQGNSVLSMNAQTNQTSGLPTFTVSSGLSEQLSYVLVSDEENGIGYVVDTKTGITLAQFNFGLSFLIDGSNGSLIRDAHPTNWGNRYGEEVTMLDDDSYAVSDVRQDIPASNAGTIFVYDDMTPGPQLSSATHDVTSPEGNFSDEWGKKLTSVGTDKIAASGNSMSNIHVVSKSGIPIVSYPNPDGGDYRANALDSVNDLLVVARNTGNVYIYDTTIPATTPTGTISKTVTSLATNNDMGWILIGGTSGKLYLYDVADFTNPILTIVDSNIPSSPSLIFAKNKIVVGSESSSPGGINSAGSIYIYSPITGGLIERIDFDQSGAHFGAQVGFIANNIVVAADEWSGDGNSGIGRLFVYENINNIPISNAQVDLPDAYVGQTITLDGTGSVDVDGDSLTYKWSQTDSNGFPITISDSVSTSFVMPDASVGTVLEFSLVVNDGVVDSTASTVTVTATSTPQSVSDPPHSLTATVLSDSEITLTWTTPSDNGGAPITGYSIERESPSGAGFSIIIANTGSSIPSFTDVSLFSLTEYNYRVSAINAIGTSISSNEVSAITEQSNAPPTINDITTNTDEDNSVTINLTGTDSDGDSLLFSIVTQPLQGIISAITKVTSTISSVVYTPFPDINGNDSFTYVTNDGEADSDIGTVSITINSINDAPVANNDDITTPEDTPVTIPVLSNDSDVEFAAAGASSESSGSSTASSQSSSTVPGVINSEGTFVAYYDSIIQSQSQNILESPITQDSSSDSQQSILDGKLSSYTSQLELLKDELKLIQEEFVSQKADYTKIKKSFAEAKDSLKTGEITPESFQTAKDSRNDAHELFLKQKESFGIKKDQLKEKRSDLKEIISGVIEQRQGQNLQQDSVLPSKIELKKIKQELKIQRAEFKKIKTDFKEQKESFQSQKESFAKLKKEFADTKRQFKKGEIPKESFHTAQQEFSSAQKSFQDSKESFAKLRETFAEKRAEFKISKQVKKLFANNNYSSRLATDSLSLLQTPRIPVYVEFADSAALDNYSITTTHDGMAVATLSESDIVSLSQSDDIKSITLPQTPEFYSITSQGVSTSFANLLHDDSITGSGVTVAVIDDSFFLSDPEIASNITHSALFDSQGSCGGTISCGKITSHGTATSQIVVDMAPEVSLELYAISNSVDFANSINDIITRGTTDVISVSLGFPASGGDGTTGYFRDGTSSVAKAVNSARDAGILVAVAAGNEAQRHWGGTYSPSSISPGSLGLSDYQSVMEFAPTASGLQKACLPINHEGWTVLSWNAWDSTTQDYDLFFFDGTMSSLQAFSATSQADSAGPPIETIYGTVLSDRLCRPSN